MLKIVKQIDQFYKLASQSQLEDLLYSALKNNNRDDYLVFLDLLEEQRPDIKEELLSRNNLFSKLNVLCHHFPSVIKGRYHYFLFDNNFGFKEIAREQFVFNAFQIAIIQRKDKTRTIDFNNPLKIENFNVWRIIDGGGLDSIEVRTKNENADLEDITIDSNDPSYDKFLHILDKVEEKYNKIYQAMEDLLE